MFDDDYAYSGNEPRPDCMCRHCRSGGYYWQHSDCMWYRADGDHRGAPGVNPND